MELLDSISALYIHIPFCRKKCSYCDYFSDTTCNDFQIKKYINKLISDIVFISDKYNFSKDFTIYIGGGTPTILSIDILSKLLSTINKYLPEPIEFTIEANPESLTKEKIALFDQDKYLSRISMGVQSLSNETNQHFGRISTIEDTYIALEGLDNFWNKDLNLDFIAGLITQENQNEFLDILQNNNINHISLYQLTVENGTKLYNSLNRKQIDILNEDNYDTWEYYSKLLTNNGYNRYEISNFCKDGYESIHNLHYWKMDAFLGIGASASSLILQNNKTFRITFNSDINDYNFSKFQMLYEIIEKKDAIKEFIMMGLRTTSGIEKERFTERFDHKIDLFIEKLSKKTQLQINNGIKNLSIFEKSLKWYNSIVVDFFQVIDDYNL